MQDCSNSNELAVLCMGDSVTNFFVAHLNTEYFHLTINIFVIRIDTQQEIVHSFAFGDN